MANAFQFNEKNASPFVWPVLEGPTRFFRASVRLGRQVRFAQKRHGDRLLRQSLRVALTRVFLGNCLIRGVVPGCETEPENRAIFTS